MVISMEEIRTCTATVKSRKIKTAVLSERITLCRRNVQRRERGKEGKGKTTRVEWKLLGRREKGKDRGRRERWRKS